MTEKILVLEDANPREVYGDNNRYLNLIKSFYPKLKITARGDKVTVNGDQRIIEQFEEKLEQIVKHIQKYNVITENQIERIVMEDGRELAKTFAAVDDVLVHGPRGQIVKARTLNQKRMVQAIDKSDMVFAIGPAGTGKTYTSVALAVRAMKNKEVRRIILTRPAVEAGENLGFLPGDMKEKLDPYMQPLYDSLRDMIPHEKLESLIEMRAIEIAPLAFMRGRTLDHAFVILDEAQNTTHAQMKMFLTRMGKDAKFIITGDVTQIDLPRNQGSGLKEALRLVKDINGIEIIELDDKDVIRHQLVRDIIHAYDKNEQKND